MRRASGFPANSSAWPRWRRRWLATLRQEAAAFDDLAGQAVDAYTQDRRVIGNSLFARAREHSLKATALLSELERSLAAQEAAARDEVLNSAGAASRVSLTVGRAGGADRRGAHGVHPALHPAAAAFAGRRGAGDQCGRHWGRAAARIARRGRRDDACAAPVPRQPGRARPAGARGRASAPHRPAGHRGASTRASCCTARTTGWYCAIPNTMRSTRALPISPCRAITFRGILEGGCRARRGRPHGHDGRRMDRAAAAEPGRSAWPAGISHGRALGARGGTPAPSRAAPLRCTPTSPN